MSFCHTLLEDLQLPSGITSRARERNQAFDETTTSKQYSLTAEAVVSSCVLLFTHRHTQRRAQRIDKSMGKADEAGRASFC